MAKRERHQADAPAPPTGSTDRPAGISDGAVKAGTGRTWGEWFAILDDAGATKGGHKGIVAVLSEHHRVGPWWRQMVAVGYEQERGLRQRHQTPDGFQLSVSTTVAVPVDRLFDAWVDEGVRSRWLSSAAPTVRKATRPKSIRITWPDGSPVNVSFSPSGNGRSRVAVEHKRLRDAGEVGRMKGFWSGALTLLKETLET